MNIKTAYVKVFGAAGAALDELYQVRVISEPVCNAIHILQTAINETETTTDIPHEITDLSDFPGHA